jgi:hypothetical protein
MRCLQAYGWSIVTEQDSPIHSEKRRIDRHPSSRQMLLSLTCVQIIENQTHSPLYSPLLWRTKNVVAAVLILEQASSLMVVLLQSRKTKSRGRAKKKEMNRMNELWVWWLPVGCKITPQRWQKLTNPGENVTLPSRYVFISSYFAV